MTGWLALAGCAGVLIGVLLTRTISSRGEAKNSLQLETYHEVSDKRIAEAVRSLPIGLVLADESGEVIYRNAHANSYERGPRVSKALVRGHVKDLLAEAAQGNTEQLEVDLFGPPRLRLRFSGRPVVDADRQIGAAVMISDITEEHRIDQVRKDFVANVSHELKTPVGAMSILAETLSVADDPETVARLSGRIRKAATRLGETVDDLLTLSTIEASEPVEFVPLVVSDFVSEAIEMCRDEAQIYEVALSGAVQASGSSGGLQGSDQVSVLGNRPQLLSALNNLITNAIKYSAAGGDVVVGLERESEWVDIAVVDRGIGIPEKDLQRIFERFYRVDTARSRSTGGTGLGLSIVRHVALNHGGEVTVTSEEGKGSTFTMRLPVVGSGS